MSRADGQPAAHRRMVRAAAVSAFTCGLALACSQQPPGAGGAAPSAAPSGDSAAAQSGVAAAATASASQPAAAAPGPVPAGMEAVAGVVGDPALAADAQSPGQATARWGSGPAVDATSPWRSIGGDGIHERGSDAVGLLQEPRTAFRGLPRARSGNFVDWAAALRVGSQGQTEVLDLDIRFTDTKSMPVVTFPHRTHTEWLSCSNCHDWLFKAKAGANDISMGEIARGRACGLCHGKVAFPATECFRCHDGPRPGA